jgi:MFS family permease
MTAAPSSKNAAGIALAPNSEAGHGSLPAPKPVNSPRQVLLASLVGTTIEFFDFYIYATAAVLVFPKLFFPSADPATATLASLATFGIAFLARPIGSALFGHFGDRIGRKTTLVIALATMGLSTVSIGLLPTYSSIGLAAPLLLALCRFGQGIGLWVRLTITETPVFQESQKRGEQVRLPTVEVFRKHMRALVAGTLLCMATFVLFYLMIVFALSWGTTALHIPRGRFLQMQLVDTGFFALMIPVSAVLAERGRRKAMLWITAAIFLFGFVMAPIFEAGQGGALAMMALGLALMGMTYGPLGTVISELFPTPVRYSGSSLAFNFAGILGASLAPYIATWLATHYGLPYVGYYLSASAVLTMVGLLMIRETKDEDLGAG